MRKIRNISLLIVLLLGGASTLFGQHYVGVRGGYGAGYGRFYPTKSPDNFRRNQKLTWGLANAGIAWKYYSPEKYVGGIGAEVEFLQKGYEFHINSLDSDTTYRRTINTINVPFIWQPHINIANNKMRLFLNAGISVSYNINSHEYRLIKGEGVVYSKPYDMNIVRDNPFGFGLQGGLGFNVIMNKWEFTAEARYYFSYGDILRNKNKYPGAGITTENPLRSPVDNISISIGLFYRIGDKPHAPAPSPGAVRRQQQKILDKEAKQREKEAEKLAKETRKEENKAKKASKSEPTAENTEEDNTQIEITE